jgi:hypothetical protein
MFERLILCEYAVADLTTANANVFYELGVRHAVRPASTVLVFAEGMGQLPFDVRPLRGVPYKITPEGKPGNIKEVRTELVARLNEARTVKADSPLYQLVEEYPNVQHEKTDVFRQRVRYAEDVKQRLVEARSQGVDAIRAIEQEQGNIQDVEAGVAIDIFLSYRDVKAWDEMIALATSMSPALASTVLVREQLALALNRAGEGVKAEKVLLDLIAQRGPSSETYGIVGRVYKDRWEKAEEEGDVHLARGLLDKAINAYLKGFETDWRDPYPGVNVVTLMELKEPPDERRERLVGVVRYAAERRRARRTPDYWDHATILELAVLAKHEEEATAALGDALASVRAPWEPETTARNLCLIRKARQKRGDHAPWATELEEALDRRASE